MRILKIGIEAYKKNGEPLSKVPKFQIFHFGSVKMIFHRYKFMGFYHGLFLHIRDVETESEFDDFIYNCLRDGTFETNQELEINTLRMSIEKLELELLETLRIEI